MLFTRPNNPGGVNFCTNNVELIQITDAPIDLTTPEIQILAKKFGNKAIWKSPIDMETYPIKHNFTIRLGRDKLDNTSVRMDPMMHPTPILPKSIPSFSDVSDRFVSDPRALKATLRTSAAP
mmetsp:Transcript_8698/g.18885  ORF Transcript_8698/g.18885 Transcript_8698/m.18885 type:complete len:122 (+) Transcript_8698:266-631(+)